MIKLPEPVAMHDGGSFVWLADWLPTSDVSYYTASQMRQAIRDALEEAAQACTNIAISPSNVILGVAIECSDAIRKLSENIHD